MKNTVLTLSLVVALTLSAFAAECPFKRGDRIAFLGDSITQLASERDDGNVYALQSLDAVPLYDSPCVVMERAAATVCAAADELSVSETFARAAAHYRALDAAATKLRTAASGEARIPHSWDPKTGRLDMRDIYFWTTGHFPGSLWYLYEATGDPFFRERAKAWMEPLKPVSVYTNNHDIGFMMYCSYGNARRILKTTEYDSLLLQTAETLSKRFHPGLGLIRSWGYTSDEKTFLVIPDNLMNLELLEWAGKDFDRIARSHADVTMKNHFRPDGGAYHVLDYDQVTKRVKNIDRGQGASCFTAWARGQSWAIYGYAMMYRMTKDPSYLAFARKVADYAIDHPNMPADGVPPWDYGAPGEERDSSAAAIMASALLELSRFFASNVSLATRYRAFAEKQLKTLCSPAYFAAPGENGDWLLKHGVGNKPRKSEVDVPLDYGDYYFLEALLRLKGLSK